MNSPKEIIKRKFGNSILFPIWGLSHKEETQLLRNNIKYKDIHKGARCFILGNGPSLKRDNLKVLKKEIVFTVNQFYRFSDASDVKSNYHFWADDAFFKDDSGSASKEIIECMKGMSKYNEDIVSFFPLKHRKFVEAHAIHKNMSIGYFYSPLFIEDHMNEDIDFTRFSFNFGTVVQWCITMAIYMGFSEIYLLGCDNTQILTIIKSALKINDSEDHGYSYSDNERKRMEDMVSSKPLADYLSTYLNTISGYKLLYNYCNKRKIKLVNCSSTTLIDSIPRDFLNNVV